MAQSSPKKLIFALSGVLVLCLAAVAVMIVTRPSEGPVTRSSGQVDVGGPFSLTDHHGQPVTDADFADRIKLIYFGFTFCPDVCPTQLTVMTTALEDMGEAADTVVPLLISVDPERDTPEALKAYVEHFHPSLVGLTGTPEEIKAVADAYYVAYYKVEDSDTAADYLMDHTSIVYVMSPSNEYLAHFTHATTPDEMAQTLLRLVEEQA